MKHFTPLLLPLIAVLSGCDTTPPAMVTPVTKSVDAPRADEARATSTTGPAETTTQRVRHIEYHSNGRKQLEGSLVDGIREGAWTFWDTNGAKRWQGVYVNGQLHGPYSIWKGTKKYEEGVFRNGARDGRWLTFDQARDQVLAVTTWSVGNRHGPHVLYNSNRKVAREGRYENGHRVGTWFSYHVSGTKESESTYEKGRIVYRYTSWHASGNKRSEGRYENGKMQGPWTYWNDDGSVLRVTEYRNGQKATARRATLPAMRHRRR